MEDLVAILNMDQSKLLESIRKQVEERNKSGGNNAAKASEIIECLEKMQNVQSICIKIISYKNDFCEANVTPDEFLGGVFAYVITNESHFDEIMNYIETDLKKDGRVIELLQTENRICQNENYVKIAKIITCLEKYTTDFFELTFGYVFPLADYVPYITGDQGVCESINVYKDHIKKLQAQCDAYLKSMYNLVSTLSGVRYDMDKLEYSPSYPLQIQFLKSRIMDLKE